MDYDSPRVNAPDVHVTLWKVILEHTERGTFCWTEQIWQQLKLIQDSRILDCLNHCNRSACLRVGEINWPDQLYLDHLERIQDTYRDYISELNEKRKRTIDLVDCSIVSLAVTLNLPVLSMEKPIGPSSTIRLKIPDLCAREDVQHYDLTGFFRTEGITV